MTITGFLSDFSLPELFQFLEQGQKTGLLSLKATDKNHYIWFRMGRIVAAGNRLDKGGLLGMVQQRGWFKSSVTEEELENLPLGLYLKAKAGLQAEQLKMLFYMQVMQQVCALFQLPDAQFDFNNNALVPNVEMTGLSSPPVEVTLAGLRALKDWTALKSKLPDVTSSLTSRIEGKPSLHLNPLEWKVWEFTDSTVPLNTIAARLETPIEQIQQVAFRLIVVNVAEELPMILGSSKEVPETELASAPQLKNPVANSGISQAFLENLMGFLQGKT